jgi:glycosidase
VIYYGEEIGLRHLDGLPSKEGGYIRTGARTQMQWDGSRNAGFSTAPARSLYLPIDPARGRPTVAAQARDPASLLHAVRHLAALRRAHLPAFGPDADFEIRHGAAGGPLVYLRAGGGERWLCAFNPSRTAADIRLDAQPTTGPGTGHGSCRLAGGRLRLGPGAWCIRPLAS